MEAKSEIRDEPLRRLISYMRFAFPRDTFPEHLLPRVGNRSNLRTYIAMSSVERVYFGRMKFRCGSGHRIGSSEAWDRCCVSAVQETETNVNGNYDMTV